VLMAKGTPTQQRLKLLDAVFAGPPEYSPGSRSVYSVLDYLIAAAMAEKATGRAFEDMIQEKVFRPLGIFSAGFGMPGHKGRIDQPKGHEQDGTSLESGLQADPPAMFGPAASINMTMRDWARFVLAHLRGDSNNPKRHCVLLKAESYDKLHSSAGSFAMGWDATAHEWARGSATEARGAILTQEGSSYLWYCCGWLAPERDYAVLVATNQGGSEAAQGVLDAAVLINKNFLK
jgi:CubicO group peptidase (beta-lactamase class C family)